MSQTILSQQFVGMTAFLGGFFMKKIVFALTSIAAVSASAQTSTIVSRGMKEMRIELEKKTENTILEKLEAQRLEDEKRRMQEFESLNFSVVKQPVEATAVVPTPTSY